MADPTKLLIDGSGKLRCVNPPEGATTLYWHGDPPEKHPDDPLPHFEPSGWRTIPQQLSVNYGNYQVGTSSGEIILNAGEYLEAGPPPFASLSSSQKILNLSQGINWSGWVNDYGNVTKRWDWVRWDCQYDTATAFSFPNGGVGVSFGSALRATGFFKLSRKPHNMILMGPTDVGNKRTWNASLNVLGRTFVDARFGVGNSYSANKDFVFQDSGLATHINYYLDNGGTVTPYTTELPYISGSGDHTLEKNKDWSVANMWAGDPAENKFFYYPRKSVPFNPWGSSIGSGGFTISGYFEVPPTP